MTINDTSQQFIKTLTDNFLNTLTQQVHQKVVIDISNQMKALDVPSLITDKISQAVDTAIGSYTMPDNAIGVKVNNVIDAVTGQFKNSTNLFLATLTSNVQQKILNELAAQLSQVDVPAVVREQITQLLANTAKTYNFPNRSIPGASINPIGLTISGSSVSGGTITKFESTGIQDRASQCQVTILDNATVFENRLVAAGLEIAGDAKFKGNLILEGTIPDSSPLLGKIVEKTVTAINAQYTDGQFDQYVNRVLTTLNETGLDASTIKVSGVPIVKDSTLVNTVTGSNLQTVGILKELQVIGETLLDQTFYVSQKRVGINTIEPARTLDIWDQEVQIIAGKKEKDTAILGTIRNQNLIICANNKDQLVINAADGSVSVNSLNIGKVNHTSAAIMPSDNRPVGQLVWNERPRVGSPIGWVSLGGARWASFGTITD